MADKEFSIYRIKNAVNGKCYIGLTCQAVRRRFCAHISDAKRGTLKTGVSLAIAKYGSDAFSVEVLATACCLREAQAIERGLIAQYGTMRPNGYNRTTGGETLKDPSMESRARMSASARRGNTGKFVRTPEIRAKQSESRKAILTPEMKAHIGSFHKGKFMSPETRAKISATKIGRRTMSEVDEAIWAVRGIYSDRAIAEMFGTKRGAVVAIWRRGFLMGLPQHGSGVVPPKPKWVMGNMRRSQ